MGFVSNDITLCYLHVHVDARQLLPSNERL